MAKPRGEAGERYVGTAGGVFDCGETSLTVLLGREGFAEFVCRTPAAAEQAVADLRTALAADHESAVQLRGVFTTANMVAFLRVFFPWTHVAYYLRPALISLDEVRGVMEMGATGEREVEPWEIVEHGARLRWTAPSELSLADVLREAGQPERDWPPVPKAEPTARGIADVARFSPVSSTGRSQIDESGGMLVTRAKLVELDPARWPF